MVTRKSASALRRKSHKHTAIFSFAFHSPWMQFTTHIDDNDINIDHPAAEWRSRLENYETNRNIKKKKNLKITFDYAAIYIIRAIASIRHLQDKEERNRSWNLMMYNFSGNSMCWHFICDFGLLCTARPIYHTNRTSTIYFGAHFRHWLDGFSDYLFQLIYYPLVIDTIRPKIPIFDSDKSTDLGQIMQQQRVQHRWARMFLFCCERCVA